MPRITLSLVESNAEIEKRIRIALKKEIDRVLPSSISRIKSKILPIIKEALESSPEIESLAGGKLRADFGLTTNPGPQIISAVLGSIIVRQSSVRGSRTLAGIEILVQPSNFSNLLGLSVAEQEINGGSIPWLNWLLTQGDAIIIADFGVEYGDFGRTGEARMNRNQSPFKVDSRYSGTSDNNFITRAIQGSMPRLQAAIRGSLS